MIQKALSRMLGQPEVSFPLETCVPEEREITAPEILRLSLCQGGEQPLTEKVEPKQEVAAGDVLATSATGFALTAPAAGKVTAISGVPDIRGDRKGRAIFFEVAQTQESSVFPPLDPQQTAPELLAKRLHEAGILTASPRPIPLLTLLRPAGEEVLETVVILAADCDPGVSVNLQLLQERSADVAAAAELIGRVGKAGRVLVALYKDEAAKLTGAPGVEPLILPATYPETLPEKIQRRLGVEPGSGACVVVPLGTALAALDAVRDGKVPDEKLVSLIGPDQEPIANYRIKLGTPILDVLNAAGIKVGEKDKVIAGGPLRGFSLFSILGSIDAGVDALTVVPDGLYPNWTPDPCVNCGRCIDICPLKLQVQLIARYAEFELFDQTEALDIKQCFECGLCAVVCTANRPLLQYIRLAKSGLEVPA